MSCSEPLEPPPGSDEPRIDPVASNGHPEADEVTAYRVAEALKAAERGWPLLPLVGKRPIHREWQRAATPDPDKVKEWAEKGNVGLRTGVASGVVVVDDDTEDGSAATILDLPPTVTVETGSGKRHYYFTIPEGTALTNKRGRLPEHIDIRGNGGQVVFVGSVHPETGASYRWMAGRSPEEIELAVFPEHVVEQIRAPKKSGDGKKRMRRAAVALDQGARDALSSAATAVESATGGDRNDALNREAFRMGRWVNAGLLTQASVEEALASAAKSAGLEEQEILATIRSGLDAGRRSPLRQDGAPAEFEKPAITLEGGALPQIVEQAEDAMLKARVDLFQRGDQVVRVLRAPALTMRDIYRRAEGVLMLNRVDVAYLVESLTRIANFYRRVKDDLVLCDCPERVAKTYLARAGHWRLRRLLGVIEAPTLRPDGSVLDEPGYDPATCLYFDPGNVSFPPLPRKPTMDQAHAAALRIVQVLKDFPFLEACDQAAAVAAILTSVVRQSLRSAPLFAFRAPKMASGKSLLSDVVSMIATGRTASVMSQGRDEDEDKKRMLAILMEGICVATIDNIEHEFGGSALCSILTQESWRDRVLGKTGTATVPTAVTWMATGNNIRFVGDIVTRVVLCDLDPMVERPEERVFDVDLHEYVPEHRPQLVVDALTVLRAYHEAGRPDMGLRVFGRFEQWSEWVRSALVWLGMADPCEGRERLDQSDPVAGRLRALLTAWYADGGDKERTAAALVAHVGTGPSSLYEAVLAVAEKGGKPDARRLGNYLSKYERRPEAGYRIERTGELQGVALWRVVRIDPPPATGPRTGDAVGFVGLVGPSRQAHGGRASEPCSNNNPHDDAAVAAGHQNDSRRGSSETDPRDPRNPRREAGTLPEGAASGGEPDAGGPVPETPSNDWGEL